MRWELEGWVLRLSDGIRYYACICGRVFGQRSGIEVSMRRRRRRRGGAGLWGGDTHRFANGRFG